MCNIRILFTFLNNGCIYVPETGLYLKNPIPRSYFVLGFSVDPNDSVIGGCLAGASSNPVSHRCFIEQESLPLLLSTG